MGKIFIGKSKVDLIKTRNPGTIIDIGSPAIERPSVFSGPRTVVNKGNPANATGKITSVDIYCSVKLTNCKVATFFVVSGNYLSTRDYETIGEVIPNLKQTFPVNLNVKEVDYIGIYFLGGQHDKSDTGGSGIWFVTTDEIPCTNTGFTLASIQEASLYGTGTTAPPAPVEASRTGIYTFKTLK